MVTFIFIVVIIALIAVTVQIIKGNEFSKMQYQSLTAEEKESLVSKKTLPIAKIGLIILVIGTLFINLSGFFDESQKQDEIVEVAIPTVDVQTEIVLTPQMKFLEDNGFNENADFTEAQFREFKKAIESGLFKKVSFCEVYQKSLDITNNSRNSENEIKKLYKKYKSIPNIDIIIAFYGPRVCNAKPLNTDSYTSSSYNNTNEDANPCIISEDFIKQDLRHPSTADFSSFDCSTTKNDDGTYTILRKVSAQNSFGVESSYVYKVRLGFTGGNWVDMSNWKLIDIRSEEYR